MSLNYKSVSIPRETVSDDFVTLVEISVANNQKVKKGDLLFIFETSKSTIEVNAEFSGNVEIFSSVGTEIEVGTEVLRLHQKEIELQKSDHHEIKNIGDDFSINPNSIENLKTRFSAKALQLMDEKKIEKSVFKDKVLVKQTDVLKYLSDTVGEKVNDDSITDTSLKSSESFLGNNSKKNLISELYSASKDRGCGPIKLLTNYFFRNYFLGILVKLMPVGIILFVHKLRGVKIGTGCFVDPSAILETAYPENITLGNDVRIAAGSIIMTHIKAPHYLRDSSIMPLTIKKVNVGDHSFIGVNATVMPGVSIGTGSVIASGAVVTGNVPCNVMVAGNPAKVIKTFSNSKI